MNINKILDKYNKSFTSKNVESDNIIYSKKIEKLIYQDKKSKFKHLYNDSYLEDIEDLAKEKVDNFECITEDIYNSLYQMSPKKNSLENISSSSKRFNYKIIDEFLNSSHSQTLREFTKGKSFESFQACSTVVNDIYENLDSYLNNMYGNNINEESIKKYNSILNQHLNTINLKIKDYQSTTSDSKKQKLEKEINSLDNQINGLQNMLNSINEKIETNFTSNKKNISQIVNSSIKKAIEEVEFNSMLSESFGLSSSDSTKSIKENTQILKELKQNKKILEIAKMMGRLKLTLKGKSKSEFAKGRGAIIGLEYGNDLSRIIPSEYALLANENTKILFFKKFVDKQLLQYKQKENKPKNKGDVIILADESGSTTSGDTPAYSYTKGLALTLANILCKENRNLIYLPFDDCIGQEFLINSKTKNVNLMSNLATNLLGGGTDFNLVLNHAIERYLNNTNFKKMDILFITDGHSYVNDSTIKNFNALRKNKNVNCISILLDANSNDVNENEVKKFSDKTLKLSELGIDNISKEISNSIL